MDKRYSWKRYWCKRDERVFYDNSGYVVEPQEFFLHNFQTDIVPFENIDHYKCLILLGEPGIGKTTEISNIKEGIKIDLKEYGSEERLINDIFNSNEFQNWVNSKNSLYLVLDSLDECKIQIPTVSQIILNKLNRYKETIGNMFKIRIACRTADVMDCTFS